MIFAVEAPKYWAKGVSVIPLTGKRPVIEDWPRWGWELPPEDLREQWLRQFPNHNIGLVCGPQSGIVAVDIDTDEEVIIGMIEGVLPSSPWHRWGRRGRVMVYQYHGEQSFQIRDNRAGKSGSLIDLLGLKKQFVLPPSIHPDTGSPYRENVALLDVLDQLRPLPKDLQDLMRGVLRRNGIEAGALRYAGAWGSYVRHVRPTTSRQTE